MDTYQKEDTIMFDSPKNQSSYIKVIGVGGGGNNAVNHMYRQGITGVDFVVCNTDQKALNSSPVPNKITLGNGMGAGNNPEVARAAAEAKKDEIHEVLNDNTKMLFIAAGMGGGTGTGAAPVIAQIAKEIDLEDGYTKKILVVAIVTMPFFFEGRKRVKQALEGLEELRKHVDSVLVINNDKLLKKDNLPLPSAYALADDVLLTAAKGISEIITVDSYINIDFEDVNTVMAGSGTALMGVGIGKGDERAKDAIVMATTSELLNDNDISGAKDILLYISFSEKNVISVGELSEITDYITRLTGSNDTNVIWGEGADDSLEDEIKITLIATGFEAKKNESVQKVASEPVKIAEPVSVSQPVLTEPKNLVGDEANKRLFVLESDTTQEHVPGVVSFSFNNHAMPKSAENGKIDDDGMQIIHKEQPAVNITSSGSEPFFQRPVMPETEQSAEAAVAEVAEIPAAQVSAPSVPQQTAVETPSLSKEMQTTAEQRIRRMHDLLRNHPMGPEIVENMTTEELMDDVIPNFQPLSESDMPSSYLGQGGKLHRQDGYIGNNPD